MSSTDASFGTASLHVGTDWQVRCATYPHTPPILSVGGGSSALTITFAGQAVPGERGVEFARELAKQAARFAAECERLHAVTQSVAMPGAPTGNEAADHAAA